MSKYALVVGGTSGLGFEIAKILRSSHDVVITGRRNPNERGLGFAPLDIGPASLSRDLDQVIAGIPTIDTLVFAVGFSQIGTLSEVDDRDIEKMSNVGIAAPALLLQKILRRHNRLGTFVAITSTSQWMPRLKEPVYTASKAALAMLANSVSLDDRVGKVLVMAPSGMKTGFWETIPAEFDAMLDPAWVAVETIKLVDAKYRYRFAKILRGPPRVEITETR